MGIRPFILQQRAAAQIWSRSYWLTVQIPRPSMSMVPLRWSWREHMVIWQSQHCCDLTPRFRILYSML